MKIQTKSIRRTRYIVNREIEGERQITTYIKMKGRNMIDLFINIYKYFSYLTLFSLFQ